MIGASAEIVVADAYVKGVTGFDAEGAYQILRAAAMDPTPPPGGRGGRDHVEPYMKYGYVPEDLNGGSVSWTTEYANDDLALAALAEGLGHAADASALRARAEGYRKLYDPATGFLWSRNADGSWATSHVDPTYFGDEFVEANAWQSLWMVALDVDALAALAGGREKLVALLTEMFEKTKVDFEQNRLDEHPHERRPAPVLLGRQRARPRRGLPLRAPRRARADAEVGRVDPCDPVHPRRRRPARQRRRRDHVGLVGL